VGKQGGFDGLSMVEPGIAGRRQKDDSQIAFLFEKVPIPREKFIG
jgi:hypothetical protein